MTTATLAASETTGSGLRSSQVAPGGSHQSVEREVQLDRDWELATSVEPLDSGALEGLRFLPAQVPGTVASALRSRGSWRMGDRARFDASEHWFRCRFSSEPTQPGEELILRIGGIATISEVWLNGIEILRSDSMFAAHDVDVTPLIGNHNELLIVCRSLAAAMRDRRRSAPIARWKTRVVAEAQLRWFRTTMLGRAPGFAPEPEPVGPWRPIALIRRRQFAVEKWSRRASVEGSAGILEIDLELLSIEAGGAPVAGRMVVKEIGDDDARESEAPLRVERSGAGYRARGIVHIEDVKRWWPHTHGRADLYSLRVELDLAGGARVDLEDDPVGFWTIETPEDITGADGLALEINGERVFCRGVVWMPIDPVSLSSSREAILERLTTFRDAGFNLIRIAGTSMYESEDFHRACDELGLMVWQDLMFANLDYPFDDAGFGETARAEVKAELSKLARHPSFAVLCGNSEIEQQVGMLGLDPALGRGSFFGEQGPRIASECCPGIPYVPSAPCGEGLPFHTRAGVANYFGVGAYLRPFEDVRRSEVKFASECLAFANVPEPEMMDRMALATPGGSTPGHPAWKRRVPRDAGTGWDFEDVRDHYLKVLYGLDPVALRSTDATRYWELSRMVSGEAMAEVFGEWRRARSGCGGGIILWGSDLEPGAGWGILDSDGEPKAAYWFLKRALSPRAIWTTDEGLNGVDLHAANDEPTPLEARLRVALYRSGEHRVAAEERAIAIPAHRTVCFGVEQVLGRFADASYAYRFGPQGHDLIAVSLIDRDTGAPISQAFRFTAGRPVARIPIQDLGISAQGRVMPDGTIEMVVSSRRFLWGVRAAIPGWRPDDAYFGIEPGGKRRVIFRQLRNAKIPSSITLTAVNAEGHLAIAIEGAG